MVRVDRIIELPSVTPSYNSIKTELKPSEDCISRDAVIRYVEQYPSIFGKRCSGLIADIIKHLPSVTPTISDVENNYDIGYNCGYADAMCDIAESEDRE